MLITENVLPKFLALKYARKGGGGHSLRSRHTAERFLVRRSRDVPHPEADTSSCPACLRGTPFVNKRDKKRAGAPLSGAHPSPLTWVKVDHPIAKLF